MPSNRFFKHSCAALDSNIDADIVKSLELLLLFFIAIVLSQVNRLIGASLLLLRRHCSQKNSQNSAIEVFANDLNDC